MSVPALLSGISGRVPTIPRLIKGIALRLNPLGHRQMASLAAGDHHHDEMDSSTERKAANVTESLRDVDLDLEEKAMKIKADDLNHKTKQV